MKKKAVQPYVGQPQRYPEADTEFNLWHDNARPDQRPGREDVMDLVDKDRPSGAHTAPVHEKKKPAAGPKKKKKKVRWYRNDSSK